MQEFPINWLAILAAVIIKQAIGALWFSPALSGLAWCKLTGVSEAEMKAGLVKALIPDVIGSALMAFVLVHAVHYAGTNNWMQGAAVGFFNWLGFVAVATLGSVTFEKRPLKLYLINNGFLLLALLLMGAMLAVWP
jgi:biotin transporter BioY